MHDEAQSKTKKLKKLRTMILQAQSELKDVQTDHQREIEGLLESVREMSKELKLQMQIINTFKYLKFTFIYYLLKNISVIFADICISLKYFLIYIAEIFY